MADGLDVGVDVAERVELVLVGVGEFAPEAIVTSAFGECDDVRTRAKSRNAQEGFVFVPRPSE